MSFAKYLKAGTNPGMTRGRGYNMRGSYRGGDGESWGGRGSRGRGNNYSGPARGRSNWYKEHPGGFEQRGRYPSEGGDERYSGRGHVEEGYRRYPRQETSGYSGREHHHRSPDESPRKRMKTEHGYMQASSSRRSHEGSYSEYNRYSFSEDKGYGEERRSYRDDRRSYREHSHGEHSGYGSRDEYSHRKERLEAERGESSVMEARHPPLRSGYRGRGLERGRLRRVLRGVPRMVLVRRADGLVLKKRSIVDHPYSVRKRLISARPQEYLKKLRTQKFRRLREAEGEEVDEEKDEEIISDDDDDKEEENWDELEKVEDDDFDDFDEGVEEVKSIKEDKEENEKETNSKKKEEETEEKPKEGEEEEGDGEKETKKPEPEKVEKATVQVTIKHDSDSRAVNEDELAHLIPKHFIRLHCPHCNIRCITYKEYGVHLYSSKHANTMRKLAMKHKLSLQRMRAQQRKNQREEEEGDEEIGDVSMHSAYCPVCQLKYRTSREKHQASNLHRMLRKFLMPYCRVCNMSFQSPMQYESHMCSVVHMQRKWKMDQRILRQKELDLEGDHEGGSGLDGEDKDLDLDNFMIVDSVGVVDETGDEVEGEPGQAKEKAEKGRKEEEKKKEVRLGVEYIKKVEVLFCELCRRYLPRLDQPERAISLHCRTSLHLECYRDDRAMRREAERIHRKEMEKKKSGEVLSKKAAKKAEPANEKTENGEKEEPQTNESDEKKTEEATENPKTAEASTADAEAANNEPKQNSGEGGEAEDLDSAMDDKLWADVDKDLGELLREVEPSGSAPATEGESIPVVEIEEDKSSDEDEEDSRAEGEERYDRFRYSEKGSGGSVVEEPIPANEATVAKPEAESEPATEAPTAEESVNSDLKKDEAETEETDVLSIP